MLPRIKKVEIGKIHINDDVVTNNFFLHTGGLEHLEKSNRVTKKDFDKMLLHEPEVAIIGTGFRGKAVVGDDVHALAKKSKVSVHLLKTPDALKKFQELARKGKKVVAHVHVGE